ncbi:hypothetical protein CRG98_025693 [Punica granatum]|nr:hypothetical protein CRG98_025693 [Punica granatum]
MDRTEDTEQRKLRFFATTGELPPNWMKIKKKKGKGSRKKGFSDEQVKSLETMFESETKPEPRKKVEIAAELGLQPRQVAIWFQNRRARWKSKRVEQDYGVLKASYDNLAAEYEALQKEKQNLQAEVQRLRDMVGKTISGDRNADRGSCGASKEYCTQDNSVDEYCNRGPDPMCTNEEDLEGNGSIGCRSRDGATGISMADGFKLLNMKEEELEEEEDGSLGLLSFDSNSNSDYSLSSTAWWNFWT